MQWHRVPIGMTDDDVRNEIRRLTDQVSYYDNQYFNNSTSLISDYDYDCLVSRLSYLEKEYPHLKDQHSPIDIIPERRLESFKKCVHDVPMLSLQKTYSYDEVDDFFERVNKALGTNNVTYFCELKLDGISINVKYIDAKLCKISTRGDGAVGDDITCNRCMMHNIPDVLSGDNIPHELDIRGEALMTFCNFDKLNNDLSSRGLATLANPRNATSGALKTLKCDKDEPQRVITTFFYSVIVSNSGPDDSYRLYDRDDQCISEYQQETCMPITVTHNNTVQSDKPLVGNTKNDRHDAPYSRRREHKSYDIHTQEATISQLELWGVPVCKHHKYCKTAQDVHDFIAFWEKEKDSLNFPTDGVVIKINELKYYDVLGTTNKNPRWAIAYKYKPQAASAKLESIEYQVGRSGIVTPVANISPVEISGTVVRRASLYNENEMVRLGLHIGDGVLVKKSGEIIPKIIGVDINIHNPNVMPVKFTKICPSCKSQLININDLWYCMNHACRAQRVELLTHFVSKHAMDIKSLGKKTIEMLIKYDLVKTQADIYKLEYDNVVNFPGFNTTSAARLVTEIEKSKNRPFKNVLFGLGIPHVGVVIAENIVSKFRNMDDIRSATYGELITTPFVGTEVANSIMSFFANDINVGIVDALYRYGITMSTDVLLDKIDNVLQGRIFVLTGTFGDMSRDDIKNKIVMHGGVVLSSMSDKVNFLVAGERPGNTKIHFAETHNVRVISLVTLNDMLK